MTKYFEPDVYLVNGMPQNGKNTFVKQFSEVISNTYVFHLDHLFYGIENIYQYLNGETTDNNSFLFKINELITCIKRDYGFLNSVIIQGYLPDELYSKVMIMLKSNFKNVYDVNICLNEDNHEVKINNVLYVSDKFNFYNIIKLFRTDLIKNKKVIESHNYQMTPYSSTCINNNSLLKHQLSFKNDNLVGKNFLDIGCNNGYFVFRSREQGSNFSVGIDINESVLSVAYDVNKYFYNYGNILFDLVSIYDYIPTFKFDIVFCSSVFHYFGERQKELFYKVRDLISNGIMYIEIELCDSNDNVVQKVKRPDGSELYYPSMKTIENMIENKFIIITKNKSFKQPGCQFERYMFKMETI